MKRSALDVYRFWSGGQTFCFTLAFTINMLYQVSVVGLNPLQLVLVGTALELSALLFEVPTGVLADTVSRRLSVIIGCFIIGVSFVLQAIPVFEWILFSQVILGLGWTFTSGASDAWMVDEVGEENAGQAFVAGAQISRLAGFGSILVSVGLGLIDLRLALLTAGIGFWLVGAVLILTMPEAGFTPRPRGEVTTWRHAWNTFSAGLSMIRARRVLGLLVLVSLVIGIHSEGYDRLWTAHMVHTIGLPNLFEPVVWFGLFGMVSALIAWGITERFEAHWDFDNLPRLSRTVNRMYLGVVVGIIGFAFAPNFVLGVVFLLAVSTLRSLIGPLHSAWLNRNIDSGVRATVLSTDSQINAFGQIAAGPLIGYIGLTVSLPIAIALTGVLLLPAVVLVWQAMRLQGGGVLESVES